LLSGRADQLEQAGDLGKFGHLSAHAPNRELDFRCGGLCLWTDG
jgi:hypothetical protein